MRITYLAYWMGINLFMCVKGMTNVEYRYLYYSTGEEITLKCDCKAGYWNGPALENTGVVISQVDETDIYGEVKTWNISIYTKGDTFANTLPQTLLRRLHVINDNFDLHITNLSLSDEGLYICDPIGHDCFGIQNRYILQNQYKPSIKVNISDTFIVEGETTYLCCTSTSKPKPTSILLYKEDKVLVSTNSRSSLCYKMINVSRNDTGNYTCFSKNEIGNASSEIPLVISYPPVVNIRHSKFTEDSKNIEIQCIAQGEPDSYNFFPWEHRSHFDQHIRYLGARDDGILHLPDVNVLNRYQDTGIYICNVSNGIPDYHGNVFQLDKAYIVLKGPPVFMKKSQIVQYGKEGYQNDLTVYVYSDSNITCSVVSNLYGYLFPHHVKTELIITSADFHGTTITLDGRQVVFSFPKLSRLDFQMYMVTLCNRYGNNSIHVELRRKVNYSKEEKTLSSECIFITIIVFLIIIVAGMGIYIRYLKQVHRKRMITSINIQTHEVNVDESAHYAEIFQTDDILNTGQGNNDQSIALADRIRVVVKNRDISNVPEDLSSTISDNDANGSDILDDGYEKPYSTLMEIDRDDYEHVYLSVRNNLTNENSTFLENTASGNSSGFTEVHYIPDKTKSFSYANDCLKNVNLSYAENNSNGRDNDFQRPYFYKQNDTVEYINLSLKQ